MKIAVRALFGAFVVFAFSGCSDSDPAANEKIDADVVLEFNANNKSHAIADTMWGIFFEDINYAADGGLYPELVRNRSFEDRTVGYNPQLRPTQYWVLNYGNLGTGTVSGAASSPLNAANPNYAAINVTAAPYVLANRGYDSGSSPAMAVVAGAVYHFYFYARQGTYSGNIACKLENGSGASLANTIDVTLDSSGWKKYGPYTFTATGSGNALLSLRFEGTGSLDLDFVSLMPAGTWGYGESKWPYGGLRKDLVLALRDLNPGFIRFPGGCIVEGAYRHNTHYNWKDTVGKPEERKENSNLWGYMMSYGLGFHEYFQLCEDLGAEPVPVLYAGLVCQARREGNFEADLAPGSTAMNQLIQDYLDLIEYANGSASTSWGAKRAANGHPEPFNLKKIGIGNENWDTVYFRNYGHIREKVLAAYPNMDIITSTGPFQSGWINDIAWPIINEHYTSDIVDEHYYEPPSWFISNTMRYDSSRFPRNGVRIFVGEYAAHETGGSISRPNTWNSAISEAAYMTGLERNADIVKMTSYAPLFARQGMVQWTPDMIWFTNSGIASLTPNYHVQRLFANNTGKYVLPPSAEPGPAFIFQSTSIDGNKIYSKLVNPRQRDRTVYIRCANIAINSAKLIKVSAASLTATSLTISEEAVTAGAGKGILFDLPANTMAILKINEQ